MRNLADQSCLVDLSHLCSPGNHCFILREECMAQHCSNIRFVDIVYHLWSLGLRLRTQRCLHPPHGVRSLDQFSHVSLGLYHCMEKT